MEQSELFKPAALSDYNKAVIVQTMSGLMEWGTDAHIQPHIRSAILEYFNKLKVLMEGESDGRDTIKVRASTD